VALLAVLCLAFAPACRTAKREDLPLKDGVELPELSQKQAEELGAWVAAVYSGSGGEPPAGIREGRGSAYVALRDHGKFLAEAWGSDGDLDRSLKEALEKAKAALPDGATPNLVELDLAHSFTTIDKPIKDNFYRFASGKRTGIRGVEMTYGDHYLRMPPTKMLAAGDRFRHVARRFFKNAGIESHDEFVKGGGKARVFEAQQFLVYLPSGEGIKLLRGNVYVEPREVTQANTQKLVDMLIDWMLTHLHEDGRMTYMWLPGDSIEEPGSNNMIRQWMATNALVKVAQKRNDPELWDRIAKNIDYNLAHFYRQEGEFGLIEYGNKVKLGAVSLAAMSIINHPQRAKWKTQEHGLRRTVAELWSEDGSFDCFYKPRDRGGRNGNVQNFYPGETLLLWSQLYRESRDPELLRRFVKSFHYYKDWHLDPSDPKRRRPSFTPWHTQADYILWQALREGAKSEGAKGETAEGEKPEGEKGEGEKAEGEKAEGEKGEGEKAEGEKGEGEKGEGEKAEGEKAEGEKGEGEKGEGEKAEGPELTPEGWPVGTTPETPVELDPQELVDFVFEMNDWLIEWMAVWEKSAFDDEKGRFFSRERDYGGAHASATGVYIEGIIDAYAMAKAVGDKKREELYRKTLARAIRSVMQLQYVDEVDMFYVTDREQTKGGLRTTVMRNEVRVDNVQHVLMGLLKLMDRFSADDFSTD
jgi:hypothetical protein